MKNSFFGAVALITLTLSLIASVPAQANIDTVTMDDNVQTVQYKGNTYYDITGVRASTMFAPKTEIFGEPSDKDAKKQYGQRLTLFVAPTDLIVKDGKDIIDVTANAPNSIFNCAVYSKAGTVCFTDPDVDEMGDDEDTVVMLPGTVFAKTFCLFDGEERDFHPHTDPNGLVCTPYYNHGFSLLNETGTF